MAEKIAAANIALEELPVTQRAVAIDLAEELRTMSVSVARAANLGAKTGHRLHALANSEVAKVDDADPLASLETLRNVGVLTKLGNDSLAPALNLLAANKDRVKELNTPPPEAGPPLRPQISRDEWLKTHGLA